MDHPAPWDRRDRAAHREHEREAIAHGRCAHAAITARGGGWCASARLDRQRGAHPWRSATTLLTAVITPHRVEMERDPTYGSGVPESRTRDCAQYVRREDRTMPWCARDDALQTVVCRSAAYRVGSRRGDAIKSCDLRSSESHSEMMIAAISPVRDERADAGRRQPPPFGRAAPGTNSASHREVAHTDPISLEWNSGVSVTFEPAIYADFNYRLS